MATRAVGQEQGKVLQTTRAIAGTRYDWIMALICLWLMVGGYSDAWAHSHLPLDNFFTPWHGAFYSGIMVALAFLGGTLLWNLRKGYAYYTAMPAGSDSACCTSSLRTSHAKSRLRERASVGQKPEKRTGM